MDRGCRDISGVIGPLLEGAEVSDDGGIADDESRDVDVALPHAVYTNVQMLEKHPQNCHFRHFRRPSARLAGGKARSATRCGIMRSDIICARPGRSKTEWV